MGKRKVKRRKGTWIQDSRRGGKGKQKQRNRNAKVEWLKESHIGGRELGRGSRKRRNRNAKEEETKAKEEESKGKERRQRMQKKRTSNRVGRKINIGRRRSKKEAEHRRGGDLTAKEEKEESE